MKNLIEALQIFLKYGNPDHSTHCEHDAPPINISSDLMSEEDIKRLQELGFHPDKKGAEYFYSFKFGSR